MSASSASRLRSRQVTCTTGSRRSCSATAAAAQGEIRARARGLSPKWTNSKASESSRSERRKHAASVIRSVPKLTVSTKRPSAQRSASVGRCEWTGGLPRALICNRSHRMDSTFCCGGSRRNRRRPRCSPPTDIEHLAASARGSRKWLTPRRVSRASSGTIFPGSRVRRLRVRPHRRGRGPPLRVPLRAKSARHPEPRCSSGVVSCRSP